MERHKSYVESNRILLVITDLMTVISHFAYQLK